MGVQADAVTEAAASRVGTLLKGKYRLERLLGVGGMAAVYAATHRNGSRVAVKVLHPMLSIQQDIRSRFLREGYVANAVEHPGAVRVIDDDVAEDGAVFLVMELLSGRTIDAVWERAGWRLRPDVVLAIAHQLLDVLAAAHEHGIVHRDVKPENMFLTDAGQLKLLDFGIARMRDVASASTATRTGTTLGTPAFMSPEQALGKAREMDALCDVYSAGAVMFALVSGRYVHEGETPNELMIYAATRPARPVREVAPDLSEHICNVIDRAVAFDKRNRWASARDMIAAIEAANRDASGRPLIDPASLAHAVEAAVVRPVEVSASSGTMPLVPLGHISPTVDDAAPGPGTVKWSRVTPAPHVVGQASAATDRAVGASRLAWVIGASALLGLAVTAVAFLWLRSSAPPNAAGLASPTPETTSAPTASGSASSNPAVVSPPTSGHGGGIDVSSLPLVPSGGTPAARPPTDQRRDPKKATAPARTHDKQADPWEKP